MNIIKLNAIDSTNSFLKKLVFEKGLENYTVVSANYQTNGRGQMNTIWQSKSDKNLTFSILIKFNKLSIVNRFYISMAVSLGVINTLNSEFDGYFKVKWPNDIMAEKDKVAGILIENVFKGNFIKQTIIGIGLNVNQVEFPESINNATSLKIITGKNIDKKELLIKIVNQIKESMFLVENNEFDKLKNAYLNNLFGYKMTLNFYDIRKGANFIGKIIDINQEGELVVSLENKTIRKFNLKEIKFANR